MEHCKEASFNQIIVFGSPGAGKSTISDYLVSKYNFNYICIGDELRSIAEEDSNLARKVKEVIDGGNLVSDDLIFEIVKSKASKRFILDGFPRNDKQCEFIPHLDIDAVLYLDVELDIAKKRMVDRLRDDDTEEIVDKRLKVYKDTTLPILKILEGKYSISVYNIDANGSLSDIFSNIDNILKQEKQFND